VLVGPDESAAGQVTLRDMGTKEERRVDVDELIDTLYEALADAYAEENDDEDADA
jgi:histidyl-tRNA synthetase